MSKGLGTGAVTSYYGEGTVVSIAQLLRNEKLDPGHMNKVRKFEDGTSILHPDNRSLKHADSAWRPETPKGQQPAQHNNPTYQRALASPEMSPRGSPQQQQRLMAASASASAAAAAAAAASTASAGLLSAQGSPSASPSSSSSSGARRALSAHPASPLEVNYLASQGRGVYGGHYAQEGSYAPSLAGPIAPHRAPLVHGAPIFVHDPAGGHQVPYTPQQQYEMRQALLQQKQQAQQQILYAQYQQQLMQSQPQPQLAYSPPQASLQTPQQQPQYLQQQQQQQQPPQSQTQTQTPLQPQLQFQAHAQQPFQVPPPLPPSSSSYMQSYAPLQAQIQPQTQSHLSYQPPPQQPQQQQQSPLSMQQYPPLSAAAAPASTFQPPVDPAAAPLQRLRFEDQG